MRQFVDMFQRAGVVLSNFGLNFLALINFSTDDAAPLTDPYVGEIGSLDTIADTGNKLSVSSGALQIAGPTANNDPRVYLLDPSGSSNFTRIGGRTFLAKHNRGTNNTVWLIGWNNNTSSRPVRACIGFSTTNVLSIIVENTSVLAAITADASTDYFIAIVLRPAGADFFYRTPLINWRLIFRTYGITTTPQCAGAGTDNTGSGAITNDSYRVVDLPAPFNSDYGIALVNVTDFTQSVGAELLTNGDFSSWTGDNPDGWTVSLESGSDPEVTQRAANQGHAGSGTGACNFYSSATASSPQIQQQVLSSGQLYEASFDLTNAVSGFVRMEIGGVNSTQFSTVGVKTVLSRAGSNAFNIRGISTLPTDITIDTASVKLVTLNSQQVSPADGIFDFEFTQPVSPLSNQIIELRYRITDTLNYWVAYLLRTENNTQWNFRLDSVSAGVATNRIAVSNVGTVKRIQVRAIGTLHNCYTFDNSEVPTKRGSEINVSHNDTATGLNTVYSTGTTPIRLTAYAVEHVWYNLLDRAMTPSAA